ncbi:hypothetical protein WISP_34401 [Willisornis vidua]|uniref:Uncharacterized protein n=1 Tax=Willisornis vidua TaxID=1566151 RepID=A0ABQ9DJ38_9PASS|nr:hypothetical protein WISP_34401 [Willisornis vidua]
MNILGSGDFWYHWLEPEEDQNLDKTATATDQTVTIILTNRFSFPFTLDSGEPLDSVHVPGCSQGLNPIPMSQSHQETLYVLEFTVGLPGKPGESLVRNEANKGVVNMDSWKRAHTALWVQLQLRKGLDSSGQETWSSWSRSNGGYKDDEGSAASLLRGKAEGAGAAQPLREDLSVSAGRGQRMDQALLRDAQQWDKRQWAQTDAQEVPCEHEKELLYCALKQVAQSDCGVSFTWDIPEPPGFNPMPRALGWPCLNREVGPDDPQWVLPT